VKKKIIGDKKPITCRPADLLESALNQIPKDVKPYIESEEDKLTYALFPQIALEFFKKRKAKKEEAKTGIPTEKLTVLEEVAAVSVAVASYLTSSKAVKALTLVRAKNGTSPWVLTGRQNFAEHGA
jgi:oxaloacetate decarboxylase alpha subunit